MQKTGLKAKRPSKAKESEALSRFIAEGMIEKKGLEIVIIDLRDIKGTIADFFVLCIRLYAIKQKNEKKLHLPQH